MRGAKSQCGAGNGNFIARGYLCSCKKKIGYILHINYSREGEDLSQSKDGRDVMGWQEMYGAE